MRSESLLLDLYDDVLDDDDSSLNRTHDSTPLRRQDSEPVSEIYPATHSSSSSSLSSVHRSRSYTDNIETATASQPAAAAGGGRSDVHSRPRSASALLRPRAPSTDEGQATTAAETGRVARRLRSCEPSSPSAVEAVPVPTTGSTGDDSGSDDTGGGDGSGAARSSRLNQRRAVRAERRYRTADTIHDVDGRSAHDSAIHKRLSLNYGGGTHPAAIGDGTLRLPECSSAALSCESLGSFPSSSGVSSTASLYRDVGGDDLDPTSTSTKLCPDDGHSAMPDVVQTADESTDSGSQFQTSTTSEDGGGGGGLTATQRLQLMIAGRRHLNHELLLMNPALEAS